MKKLALILTVCAVTLAGCAAEKLASSQEVSPSVVSSSSEPAQAVESLPAITERQPSDDFYEMALSYLKGSLTHSQLVTIEQDGRVSQLLTFPGESYALQGVFPDGKTLLLENERESGGEATAAHYLTMDAQTGEILGQTDEKQWGYTPHVILDDNLIGFASGSVIGGQEDTWQPIKLFDRYYKPLDVTLDFDYGEMHVDNGSEYREKQIVGIGYDRDLKQYMVAFAQDAFAPELPAFFANQLGIAFFDASGKLVSSFMPEGYQAPISHNVQMLYPNNPVLIGGSIALNAVEPGAELAIRENTVVLFDKAGAMKNTLSVIDRRETARFSVVRDGENEYLFVQEGEQHPLISKLLLWDDKGVKELPQPSSFEVEGFPEPFYLSDVCRSGDNTYAAAQTSLQLQTDWVYLTGIFVPGEKGYDLLHLIPAQYQSALVPSGDGGVTFSVTGIGVERESNINYQDLHDRALTEIELLEQLLKQ